MRSLKTYYSILQKKGLYTCLREAKKALWPVWFTHSRAAIEQIQAERVSRYIWRRYDKLISVPLAAKPQQTDPPKTIWICWLQGEQAAPEIVKQCIASVRHYATEYTIRLLTADNIAQFVTLPNHIWRKYHNGTITFTHFSDILRTALLVQHGGIWLDATVMLTNELPKSITKEPLFFFQKPILQTMPHLGSSWFIISQKGNPILQRTLDLLCEYWRTETILRDYFLFHIILFIICTKNKEASEMLKDIPYIDNTYPHLMQFSLFDTYTDSGWQRFCEVSPIHKLTWKFSNTPPYSPNNKRDTYYDHILHHLHL